MTFRSSRRRFIASGTAAGCAALLPAMLARASVDSAEPTASRFRPFVGGSFAARPLSGTSDVTLTLRAVRPLVSTAPGMSPGVAQERSFELIFETGTPKAAQDVYEIAHPRAGTFAAFMVPSRDGSTLLATFNRLR